MNHSSLLLIPALLAPALLSLGSSETLPVSSSETRIEFKPTEGTVVKRSFVTRADMALDSMDMKMNGQAPPMMPDMEMTITTEVTTVVEDEILSSRDGRILRMKRHFTDIAQRMDMQMEMDMMGQTQSQDMSTPASSELEGETVLFVWDESEEEYSARWPEGHEGKAELLTGLIQDMDLSGFLPKGAVTEGQTWKIEPSALMAIMAPGGDLKLVPDDMDSAEMAMMGPQGSLSDWFGENMTGSVTGTFQGVREEGGRKLGAIRIEFSIKNAVDMTKIMEAALDNLPPEAGEIKFDHMDMEIQYDGEGLLLWNLEQGIARSFESSGDFGMLMDMGMSVDAGGMDMNIQMTMEMSGTLSQTATFE